ncbi:MAG: WD40/YVTN/BNR-like repeat-containing protein [Acidimicrobiales bacterium]
MRHPEPVRAGTGHRSAPVIRRPATALVIVAVGAVGAGCSIHPSSTSSSPGAPAVAAAVGAVGQPAPPGSGFLTAVACGSPRDCWAVGEPPAGSLTAPAGATTVVIDATADGGRTWHAQKVAVPGPTSLTAIACSGTGNCMAVGSADVNGTAVGTVLVTTDGGRVWSSVGPPPGSVDVSAVACAAADQCLVLASGGAGWWSASTADGGQAWQRTGSLPTGFAGADSLSCTGPTQCVTVGYAAKAPGQGTGAAAVTDDGGTSWSAASIPTGTGLLHGVDCPTLLSCIAVGTAATATSDITQAKGQLLTSTDGGHTWTALPTPIGVDDAFSIACPTTTSCIAVGTRWTSSSPPTPTGGVVVSTDAGTSWADPPLRYLPSGLTAVACPGVTTCVAAGGGIVARVVLPAPVRHRA